MSERFEIKQFNNGLTLVAQPMEAVSSASMSILVPAGASYDPAELGGAASIATEWALRGAGDRDTRELNDALDNLGCQHSESVRSHFVHFSATQLGRNLSDALEIYADIIHRPRMEEKTFDPCRGLILQDLASLEDEPMRKSMMMLREKFYPSPLGRMVYGTEETLAAASADAVREHWKTRLTPRGTIIAIAGNVDWDALLEQVGSLFGDWNTEAPPELKIGQAMRGETHIKKKSAQTHITLAHPTIPASDESYYIARIAETVLSGGMSSRLFTEVREKRGLVYHVSSRYHSLKNHAGMFTYAGTVPEKAQETFNVTVSELRKLADGVTDDELARAKTQLKSSLVMQGESTAARAGSIAADWFHNKELRTLQELSDRIDAVTCDDITQHLKNYPAKDFTVLVIGPEPIDLKTV